MSDLCMYELDNMAWDEFGDNDDHIVPHPDGDKNLYEVEIDCRKRLRYELSCSESESDNKSGSSDVIQREKTSFSKVKEQKEAMLENNPWSHSSSGPISASSDGNSNRNSSFSTCDEARTSNCSMKSTGIDSIGRGLCADDPILGDRSAAGDNNLYHYQLNSANTENDLGFCGNNLQDKESSDLLYYGWPEIENFEDVDRMFRSCDSTFGLGIDNDDEMGWFSSSLGSQGSDDVLESSFNLAGCDSRAITSATEHQEVHGLNNTDLSSNGSDKKLTLGSWKKGSKKLIPNGASAVMNPSYADGSGAVPNIGGDPQIHSQVSQPKHQKPSEGKRNDCSVENGDSFIRFDNLKQVEETKHSLNISCSFSVQTHEQGETTHKTCLQTPIPLINSNNDHISNQVLASSISSVNKSEDNGLPSISPRESSYASNQMQSMESYHDISFQNPGVSWNKKGKHQHKVAGHPGECNIMVQQADSDLDSSQKQVPNFENEVQGQSEVNGTDIGIQEELDSSNIQESSSMSSVYNEVSIEASSFRQLQHVMEKLDIRTKLCIRDSMYRLARSAEQRHKCINKTSGNRDEKDAIGAFVSDETNNGFMDIETDTNPIDRSIAHLLFHRPSDPSANANVDAVTMNYHYHTLVQAPNHHSPVVAEKLVCREETTSFDD